MDEKFHYTQLGLIEALILKFNRLQTCQIFTQEFTLSKLVQYPRFLSVCTTSP